MTMYDEAIKFWKKRAEYPPFPHTAKRRSLEADYLSPTIGDAKTVVDVGCGDGSLIRMLSTAHRDTTFIGLDIGSMWISEPTRPPNVCFDQRDVFSGDQYPEADITIAAGVLNYAFDRYNAMQFVTSVNSPRLYLRVPCSVSDEELHASGYSEKLGAHYSALYRTVEGVLGILKTRFDVPVIRRAYPDRIESEFNTKQFIFDCVLR